MITLMDISALLAIIASIMVISIKNPITSVLYLISVFVLTTLYLLTLGLGYLGLVYLIVYIGAIAILFLFVIMMLNLKLVEVVDIERNYTKNFPVAFTFIAVLLYLINIIREQYETSNFFNIISDLLIDYSHVVKELTTINETFNPSISENTLFPFIQIQAIGSSLYTYGAIWLILTAVILMLSMVGPILLCLRKY